MAKVWPVISISKPPVVSAAVHSRTIVMLVLIHALLLFSFSHWAWNNVSGPRFVVWFRRYKTYLLLSST